ncbi:MAG: DUF4870 family protein [Gammaproteobacteria bacterium]
MSQELVMDRRIEDEKNTARMLYFVHGATFVLSLGLLSILPVLFNYSKRPETAGTLVYSHHTWMIRSFWYYALWMTIGGLVMVTLGLLLIGIPIAWTIWALAWVWKAYRLIRGFLDLNSNKAMPV